LASKEIELELWKFRLNHAKLYCMRVIFINSGRKGILLLGLVPL